MDDQKTCFVVQGFGKKTDFRTGRQLDLDASYEVIKEAVTAAGLKCIRADEIQHSQVIDKPMYDQILNADLVIADLSTSNLNAVYELGVRHALRKRPTIIVAENQWNFPFDVNRNLIRTYEHLGADLGRREAIRFRDDLIGAIQAVMADESAVDSPLYTFLPELSPPSFSRAMEFPDARGEKFLGGLGAAKPEGASFKEITDQAEAALKKGDFNSARPLLVEAHNIRPNEEYIIQRLALATYKSKSPTELEALQAAHDLIQDKLNPSISNDPETIGLWAAVHKRLWADSGDQQHLDISIETLERGFILCGDYYNGINLAFMLNERACLPGMDRVEAITDFVLARRVRGRVNDICQAELAKEADNADQRYWLLATAWEAAVGLEDDALSKQFEQLALDHAAANQLPDWMLESSREQNARLVKLLEQSPRATE